MVDAIPLYGRTVAEISSDWQSEFTELGRTLGALRLRVRSGELSESRRADYLAAIEIIHEGRAAIRHRLSRIGA